MSTPESDELPTIERLRVLLDQYDRARVGMALVLVQRATPARLVLVALRGVVVAEMELLRVMDRLEDRATLDALTWELQRLDRELVEAAEVSKHVN